MRGATPPPPEDAAVTGRAGPRALAPRAVWLVSGLVLGGLLLPTFQELGLEPGLAAQTSVTLRGRVTDAETRAAVQDATVILEGSGLGAVSDAQGLFELEEVPEGVYAVRVQHLAYGDFLDTLRVGTGLELVLRIEISPEAIQLEPIEIEVLTEADRLDRARGTRGHLVTREQLEQYEGTASHMGNVLSQLVPGVRIRSERTRQGAPMCLEFRSARSLDRPLACHSPVMVIDGQRVSSPRTVFSWLPIEDIDQIEVLPPGEAGVRWGTDSSYGVILVRTRSGRRADPQDDVPTLSRGTYDWSLESAPYPWKKVFLASFAANAIGLAAGLAVGRQCLRFDGLSNHFLEPECGSGATAGTRVLLVTIPTAAITLGARYAGQTDLSRGRFLPTMVGAALVGVPGYILATASQGDSFAGSEWVGGAFLLVGMPAAATLADRLWRAVRH